MIRKNYILKESSIEVLKKVMQDMGLKSETAALETILMNYRVDDDIYSEIEFLQKEIRELKGIIKVIAKNTDILLDAVNTQLTERSSIICYPADEEPSPVILQAEEHRKKTVVKAKQKKDNKVY